MKKLFALLLTMMLVLSIFTSCFISDPPVPNERAKIRIGYICDEVGLFYVGPIDKIILASVGKI